jgi:tetratricopeptide (TPR) repeat protein
LQSFLDIAKPFGDADDAWSRGEIDRIAARVRRAIAERPGDPVARLNEVVFGELDFAREVDDRDLDFVLLPSVLRHRRGSCVGLGSLYLTLAEALGWRAAGVMVPGHFFVRVGERWRNVELLRRGEEMPDAWYRTRFAAIEWNDAVHLRPLALGEVLGIVEYDVGTEWRRRGRFTDAERAYRRAIGLFPDFAEAHASLGATLHVLGSLDAAEASYGTAARVNPRLPGVDSNLELLRVEREGH